MKASLIIKKATEWLGYNEADGSHKQIIDIYNARRPLPRGYKVKYTDSWCATFVSAVAISLNAEDIVPRECSCEQLVRLAQYYGIWVEDDSYTPSVGDIILYDWDDKGNGDDKGWSDHIGYVVSVNNGIITVIEGNLNNAVGYREIAVNGRFVRGYICPKYEAEAEPEMDPVPKVEFYPQYTGNSNSIVDALKSLGIDSSLANRKIIAEKNGISGYSGKASENEKLLTLLKQGKLIKNSTTTYTEAVNPVPAVEYYPKYDGESNSLVDALKSLGIDSSMSHRKEIAVANHIGGYSGKAKENERLLLYLKHGKLIKE
jgi:hypothetical protein